MSIISYISANSLQNFLRENLQCNGRIPLISKNLFFNKNFKPKFQKHSRKISKKTHVKQSPLDVSELQNSEEFNKNLLDFLWIFGTPVWACVFTFIHREGFFRLQDVQDILERYGSTILCCEYLSVCFCQVPSSPHLKMSYFTSKDENSSPQHTREKTIWYIDDQRKDDIYWYRI